MLSLLLIIGFIVLALLGVPIFILLALATLLGYWQTDIDFTVIGIELYRIADTPILVALPLFILAGYLLAASQASKRLVDLSQSLLGWLPGGMVLIALVSSALFTAFTGASGATIVALGALLLPALKALHYDDRFSLGMVTGAGSLGLLLPPSLPLILYGVLAQQLDMGPQFTLVDLFLAGLIPTLLLIALLFIWSLWHNRGKQIPRQAFNLQALRQSLWAARWEIPLPVFVLGGIYSGVFAISDIAAATVLYVFVAEVLLYREVSLKQLPQIFVQAATMIGGIILILGVALAFSNLIIDAEVPQQLLQWTQQYVSNVIIFLLVLNIALLLLGAVLDIFSALVIMVPLLLPLALNFGIHPIHLGVILLTNLQIGYLTPPVGMNLFISSYRFQQPITTVIRAVIPLVLLLLAGLLVITYVPALSLLWLSE